MKKVLVLGGNSFIGKNLIPALQKKNFQIYSVSRSSSIRKIKNFKIDLRKTDFDFLEKINPDYIIYLATVSSPKMATEDPQACFETNVTVIQKFLEKVKENKRIKKIIFFSTAVLYKDQNKHKYSESDLLNPNLDMYNLSKFLLENLTEYYRKKFNLNITVFRLSNTYGPFQDWDNFPTLIPQMFKQALKNKKIEIFNGSPTRDFIFVEDVVKIIIKELGTKEGGLFNLGTGKGTKVGDIGKIISILANSPCQDLKREVNPPYKVVLNTIKLNKHLEGLELTGLEEGLGKTFEYYRGL